jgi:hypothetical protein
MKSDYLVAKLYFTGLAERYDDLDKKINIAKSSIEKFNKDKLELNNKIIKDLDDISESMELKGYRTNPVIDYLKNKKYTFYKLEFDRGYATIDDYDIYILESDILIVSYRIVSGKVDWKYYVPVLYLIGDNSQKILDEIESMKSFSTEKKSFSQLVENLRKK